MYRRKRSAPSSLVLGFVLFPPHPTLDSLTQHSEPAVQNFTAAVTLPNDKKPLMLMLLLPRVAVAATAIATTTTTARTPVELIARVLRA